MVTDLTDCQSCGRVVLRVIYLPDLSTMPSQRGHRSRILLEPGPAADQEDEAANYAVNLARDRAHLITEGWPLIEPERRHFHHYYASPACRPRQAAPDVAPEDVTDISEPRRALT